MSNLSTLTGVPTATGEPEQAATNIEQQLPVAPAQITLQNETAAAAEQISATLPIESTKQTVDLTNQKPIVEPSPAAPVVDSVVKNDDIQVNIKSEPEINQPEEQIIPPCPDINPKNVLNDVSEEIGQEVSDNLTTPDKEESKTDKPEENTDEKEQESGKIDIKELTAQILNIITEDDGKEETAVLSPQQLLKKNVELQEFVLKLIQVLREKTDLCGKLERQNTALIGQAQSLREVIAITKDLLGIRNMEVEHLHQDMKNMEERIKDERVRHNTAVSRLNEAMKLNDQLKNEYLVQMDLFQRLRDKYNEKVVILTKENKRLLEIIRANGLENLIIPPAQSEDVEEKIVTTGEAEIASTIAIDNGSPGGLNETVEEIVDK